jgi:hypothetical protein
MILERRDPSSGFDDTASEIKRRARAGTQPSPRRHPPPRSPSKLAPRARATKDTAEQKSAAPITSIGTRTNRTGIDTARTRTSCVRTHHTSSRSRTRTRPGRTRIRHRTNCTPSRRSE